MHLPDELYKRMLQLLHDIKVEIDQYRQDDVHVLRAYLYEALMLLNRAYQNLISMEEGNKEAGGTHISKFIELVGADMREHHSVRHYADKLAFELHFSTVSYFVRCFRQCTGETPLVYRSMHKP